MIKNYLQSQFQFSMFNLEHEPASDFYLSCWQRNRTTLPLLCIRLVLFLACVGILVASLIFAVSWRNPGLWFIYMTHWGVLSITITTLFATAVSCRAYFKGPIDSTFSLPWYIKCYWAAYNTTIPLAIFITIYYYSLLTVAIGEDLQLDPILDFFIHGMNSILMLILLMTSRHPMRLMHFYFVILIAIVYLAFSGIYYAAGGVDPLGNHYIYPTLDWSKPGEAAVMAVITAVVLLVVYIVVVALEIIRHALSRKCMGQFETLEIK